MLFKRMKKSIAVLLCAVLLVSSLSALSLVSVVAEGTNLVTNGDFETGDTTGWSSTGTNTLSMRTDGYAINGGTLCISDNNTLGNQNAYQTITVEKNTLYSFSCDFRTTQANRAYFRVYAGSAINADALIAEKVIATATWNSSIAKASGEFDSGNNTQVTICIYNNCDNIATVDNVVVEKKAVTVNDALVNGTFETDLSGWEADSGITLFDAGHTWIISGSNSMRFPGGTSTKAIQRVKVNADSSYNYSFNARSATTNGTIELAVRIYGGLVVNDDTLLAESKLTAATWNGAKSFSGSFDTGAYETITICASYKGNDNYGSLDDVTLTENLPTVNDALVNGTFETDLSGWDVDSGVVLQSNLNANWVISGNNSIGFPGGKATNALQRVKVNKDATYKYTFKARSATTNGTIKLAMSVYGGYSVNSANLLSETVLNYATWNGAVDLLGSFETGNYEVITIRLSYVGNDNWGCIDDITLEETTVREFANGDFEENTTAPWVDANGKGLTLVPSGNAYLISGNYTLRLAQGGIITQTIKVDVNSRYMFDASVRTNEKKGIYFRVYSGTSAIAENLLAETASNCQTWDHKVLGTAGTFETDEFEVVTLQIENKNGAAWVDDITLTKLDVTVNESLVNGDFETGDTTGWITTSVASIYTNATGTHFINGSALQLTMGEAAIQYVRVKPNTAYSYHLLSRMPEFNSQANGLKVRVLSGAAELASELCTTFNGDVNATHNAAVVDGVFVSDNTGIVKIMVQNDHMNISVVDDIAITEIPATLVNGNFDDGLNGWNPASSGYVDSETSVYTNTIIDSGDYAINGNTVQFGKEGAITQIIKVTPNTVYGFGAKGRTGDNPYLSIKVWGGSNFDTLLTTSDLETTTWADTPKDIESVFNSGANSYVKITVSNGSTTNAAWIDDITILAQESASPISLYGTSVLYRLYNDAQGLRFAFEIPENGESFNMYGKGYKVVCSGTLVGLKENLGEDLAAALTSGSSLAKDCPNNRTYIQKDGKIVYTALITGITEDYAYNTFVARAYVVAQDTDGNTRIFYGDIIEKELGSAYESMSEEEKALVAEDAIIF